MTSRVHLTISTSPCISVLSDAPSYETNSGKDCVNGVLLGALVFAFPLVLGHHTQVLGTSCTPYSRHFFEPGVVDSGNGDW